MSLDEVITEMLAPLREEIADLRRRVELAERGLKRPVYDATQLQEELGFSHGQAYNVRRAHGTYIGGRGRISATDLICVFSRDEVDVPAPARARNQFERASAVN